MLGANVRVGWPGGCQADTCKATVYNNHMQEQRYKNINHNWHVVQSYEVLVTVYLRHLTGAVPTLRGLLSTSLSS